MIDLVSVDYDFITNWLKEHHISRRKLCIDAGIPEGTIAAAFKRRSKMQVAYLWKIADYMGVKPFMLLLHDKDGNVDQDDRDRVLFGRTDYEIEVENESINDLVGMIRRLNPSGLSELDRVVSVLCEVPRFQKSEAEYFDGSDDYWKTHPRQERVKAYDKNDSAEQSVEEE